MQFNDIADDSDEIQRKKNHHEENQREKKEERRRRRSPLIKYSWKSSSSHFHVTLIDTEANPLFAGDIIMILARAVATLSLSPHR